jgi:hypothetical protein
MFELVGGSHAGGSQDLHGPPHGTPLVSTVARAAQLLGMDPGQLAGAVERAQLDPWGRHADGSAVYGWPQLCGLAVELGATIPKPGRLGWGQAAADRGRHNRRSKHNQQP